MFGVWERSYSVALNVVAVIVHFKNLDPLLSGLKDSKFKLRPP